MSEFIKMMVLVILLLALFAIVMAVMIGGFQIIAWVTERMYGGI